MLLKDSLAVVAQRSEKGVKEMNHNFEAMVRHLAREHGLSVENLNLQKVSDSLSIRWYKNHFVIPAKTTVEDLAAALK